MTINTGNKIGPPIYAALAERLRRSIRAGTYVSGQLLGSEHQLAKQERISRMTVRRASELLVNEGLLERRPGKGLYVRGRAAKTKLIQVIAGNLEWEASLQVCRGAQGFAKDRGIELQLYDAHGDLGVDEEMLRNLPSSRAQGAIIVSLHNTSFNEALYQLKIAGFPFVLVDQRLEDIEVPSVTTDSVSGGRQAGQVLLDLGHRRIAFVGDLEASTTRERLAGLRDAINDAGLPFNRSYVGNLNVTAQERFQDWSGRINATVQELMARPDRPTAIFFSCDAVARAGYRTLGQLGLRIPQDVSVVGFDDDPLAEWLTPALTTVRQPFKAMGQAAIEMLCQRMDAPDAVVEHRVLKVELVERDSTAPSAGAPRSPVIEIRKSAIERSGESVSVGTEMKAIGATGSVPFQEDSR